MQIWRRHFRASRPAYHPTSQLARSAHLLAPAGERKREPGDHLLDRERSEEPALGPLGCLLAANARANPLPNSNAFRRPPPIGLFRQPALPPTNLTGSLLVQ